MLKTLKVLFIGLFGALVLTSPVMADATALPFEETFETNPITMAGILGPLDQQHGWLASPSNNAVVQDSVAYGGDQAVGLAECEIAQVFDGTETNVWCDFYIQMEAVTSTRSFDTNATAVFWLGSDGYIRAHNGTSLEKVDGIPVTAGDWVRFSVELDYNSKEWSLWVNGTNAFLNFDFYSTVPTAMAELRVSQQGTNTIYVDDISVGTQAAGNLIADSDGDGMDDLWERANFSNSLALAGMDSDFDSDGFIDRYEFGADTDPTDPASLLGLASLEQLSPTNTVITFDTVATRGYTVSYTTNLLGGSWISVNSNSPLPGVAGQSAYTVTVDRVEQVIFYRVSAGSL